VVTAVYILRVVGALLMGPIKQEEYQHLQPAHWYEKLATVTLITAIVIIGMAPLWLSDMIMESLGAILD
jgi:NADH-quinone oxidoreductase subunit M